MKKAISTVLESVGMGEKRPAKMDLDDFLKLLSAFIDAGFRFSSK